MEDLSRAKANLYGLGVEEIRALEPFRGEPRFRALQIARWMYARGASTFDGMSDVSRQLRSRLDEGYAIRRLQPAGESSAGDDSATKYLFALADGARVEAVWIRDPRRDTLCISSQAGCAYGCTFCATATMKAGRDLDPGEIVSQVAALRERMADAERLSVHNIVFMGMGEPLANYDNVVRALRLLTGEPGLGIAARRITISTVGLEPAIYRLAEEPLGVRLAFSLNATDDETRSRLMPVNRKYPFKKVFDALRAYQAAKGEPVTLEYVLLEGVNDTPDDARRLAGFARSLQCKVNLIAYNPHRFAPFRTVPDPAIEAFRRHMLPIAGNVSITVRWSKGRDIQAACGQLAVGREA